MGKLAGLPPKWLPKASLNAPSICSLTIEVFQGLGRLEVGLPPLHLEAETLGSFENSAD